MSRRSSIYTILAALIMISLVLGGCGGGAASSSPTGKVATIIWGQDFDSLNPMYSNMWFSTVTQQLWDCWAWNFDEKNEPIPYLVTEIPSIQNGGLSADGKTITLHLRDGLKWSDNQPLTSADFRFTWAMHVDSHNTVASAYPYDKVSSIDAPDLKTIIIHFDSPFAPWISLWHGIIPARFIGI